MGFYLMFSDIKILVVLLLHIILKIMVGAGGSIVQIKINDKKFSTQTKVEQMKDYNCFMLLIQQLAFVLCDYASIKPKSNYRTIMDYLFLFKIIKINFYIK